MRKQVRELTPGDVVTRIPYPGSEALPLQVLRVEPARAKGYRVLVAIDATGQSVHVPVGHFTNIVEVRHGS